MLLLVLSVPTRRSRPAAQTPYCCEAALALPAEPAAQPPKRLLTGSTMKATAAAEAAVCAVIELTASSMLRAL